MFTPQQIDQISFDRATFGGYDMASVDEFLEPLTEDYVTLYKENALLKSKMRVLVGKLEEYRKNEAAMKQAIADTQKSCDQMILEAQEKCAKMASEASAAAAASQSVGTLVAAEKERVDEARRLAASKIEEIQEQMRSCIQALDRIKKANTPAVPAQEAEPEAPKKSADDVAAEISQNLEALVCTTVDTAPKAEPRHPLSESTTAKFANLQFGRNYDPNSK